MKSASPALIALLAGNAFRMADLLTLTLKVGGVLRYTTADLALTLGGHTYQPAPITRGRTRVVLGVEVDSLDLRIHPTADMLINGNPFLAAVIAGALDGALVKLERVFMGAWGDTSAGALHLFEGRVSDTELTGTEVRVTVRSLLELLNVKMPRNVYQAGCANSLYDAACQVSKIAFAVTGLVQAGSTREVLQTNLGAASGYFDQGHLVFSSGSNAGITRTIKSQVGGVVTLSTPLAATPTVGDGFSAWPGCDKSLTMCEARFNNRPRFRGFPWIPAPETAY